MHKGFLVVSFNCPGAVYDCYMNDDDADDETADGIDL